MPSNRYVRRIPALILIALVGGIAYSNTFTVPFQFDDDAYIVNNPVIRSFDGFAAPWKVTALIRQSPTAFPPALRYAFTTRILGYLSFAANYRLHGLNVTGYHLVNLMIHLLNGMLVFWIVRGILQTAWSGSRAAGEIPWPMEMITAVSSLLFVCHPLQTQAVTYISQRFATLASCFYLLSLLLYIRSRETGPVFRRRGMYIAALGSAVAAMLTKEFSFTLPFVIALYELTFREGGVRERIRLLIPFAVTLSIIPLMVFLQQADMGAIDSTMRAITAADVSKISRTDYLLTQFRVVPLYVRLLFLPVGQNVDHDLPVYRSFLEVPVLLSFLFLSALFTAGICLRVVSAGKREFPEIRLASFGILWFFITLSVESSVIPLGELVAEYRMYLPSVGMIVAVVSLVSFASRRYLECRVSGVSAWYGFCAAVVIILSVVTYSRNRVWASEISLWEDAARKSPGKVRPRQNLGTYYFMQGRPEDARRELLVALTLDPGDPEIHNNLGLVYKKLGEYDNALQEFRTVLQLDPSDAIAHYNLGNLFLAQGRIPEAIREYQIAVARIPDYDEAHNNLGIAYDRNGQFREAFREFQEAVRLNPGNANARNNLGKIIDKLNDSRRSRRVSPKSPYGSRSTA